MRILLVDDQIINHLHVRAVLEKRNYSVESAYSAKEALDFLKSNVYDIVLVDFLMPEMNGEELVRKIRKEDQKTPFFGYSTVPEKFQSLFAEGLLEANLSKPLEIEEFDQAITSLG